MLLGGQTTEFYMNAILPLASYTIAFPWIQFAYWSKATPLGGLAEQFCGTVHGHLASFNMVSMHFGALRGRC